DGGRRPPAPTSAEAAPGSEPPGSPGLLQGQSPLTMRGCPQGKGTEGCGTARRWTTDPHGAPCPGPAPPLCPSCRPPRGPHGAAAQDSQGPSLSQEAEHRVLRVSSEGGLPPQRPPGGHGGAGRGDGEAPGKITGSGAECEPESHPGECTASQEVENGSPQASCPPACLGRGAGSRSPHAPLPT
ncbi:unnamed protein product, partial [Rangifer tarandus platyrhynchus]